MQGSSLPDALNHGISVKQCIKESGKVNCNGILANNSKISSYCCLPLQYRMVIGNISKADIL